MFNKKDIKRNQYMLNSYKFGYDWWWHNLTAMDEEGNEKPFFIEFFVVNPSLACEYPVFGQLKENKEKGIRPSYLMVKAGCWKNQGIQLHRFFGLKNVNIQKCPFSIEADDCIANETTLKGSIHITKEESSNHPEWMCDYGDMSWDLSIKKDIAFNVGYGTSNLLRNIHAFEMYWHAQGMKSTYSGTITFNGKEYRVIPEKSYGYADKNWGSNFTSPWVWLSSNHLVSNITKENLKNSVFDIGGGRPKVFFIPLNRKLLGVFYHEGKEYDFNFSHFWKGIHTDFKCVETDTSIVWYVTQSNFKYEMKTTITCLKKDMLLVNYEDPYGNKRHNRLWNGGNGTGHIQLFDKKTGKCIEDVTAYNIGCEYGEYDKE